MITVFNGRERTLGGQTSDVHIQVSISFRNHLHTLKGARLAVFLSIALHSNQDGWSWPGRGLISRETGYNPNTVSQAVAALCQIRIKGHRLLLRYQPQSGNGNFNTNRYLIFPSPHEIAQYEHHQPMMLLPCTAEPCTENPYTVEPCTVKPCTVNLHTNHNHDEQQPVREQETTDFSEQEPSTTTPTDNDVDDNTKIQISLCNQILYNMAIFEPTKSQILELPHITPSYLKQWQYWYDENDDKISAGFIISQIRRAETAPLTKDKQHNT